MSSETHEVAHDVDAHPGTRLYWIIGLYLFILTALEIGCYYLEDTLGGMATPTILALSAAKFILVVMFFMHLKYDSKIFTGVFLFPMALATLVIGGLTILFHVLHPMGM
ncbi:MAG: cytochrome C oxidase subunit IV family protein [Gemmatimonadota bacterium]|jgi:cytochrome c oxidase subunit 4|nr:cytochrome C oxidase subunit IV family protein [Gemmatimonadota bacterium]